MAKVITDNQTVIVQPWWAKARIVLTGAGLGLGWWILTTLLKNYIVEPLACRDLSTATACVDSLGVAGNIATVLIAVVGVLVLIRALHPRPILIAIAAGALLWGLGYYATGLVWYETLMWAIVLHALAYWLFSLIARIRWLVGALVVTAITVLVIRILIAL